VVKPVRIDAWQCPKCRLVSEKQAYMENHVRSCEFDLKAVREEVLGRDYDEWLEEIEQQAYKMRNLNHEYVTAFELNMREIAKTNIDWGGGEWGEDDAQAEQFANSLSHFPDIPEFLELLQDETLQLGNQVITLLEDHHDQLSELDLEWRNRMETILRWQHTGRAA